VALARLWGGGLRVFFLAHGENREITDGIKIESLASSVCVGKERRRGSRHD